MGGTEVERRVTVHTESLASYLRITPPLESFEHYLGVCAAAYGSLHGDTYYRTTLPKPHQKDFERSLRNDSTELVFLARQQPQLLVAAERVAEDLRTLFGVPAALELNESAQD